ncbi:hypothetical protein B0H13DRAFT_2422624 [Mycena leptocephala]|nr:hypothetical protein B0H13DRAFT_2422624 [Mycena leptocephala]
MVHNINPHRNADLHDNGRPALDVGRSVIQGGVAALRNGDDSAHRIGWRRWEGMGGEVPGARKADGGGLGTGRTSDRGRSQNCVADPPKSFLFKQITLLVRLTNMRDYLDDHSDIPEMPGASIERSCLTDDRLSMHRREEEEQLRGTYSAKLTRSRAFLTSSSKVAFVWMVAIASSSLMSTDFEWYLAQTSLLGFKEMKRLQEPRMPK